MAELAIKIGDRSSRPDDYKDGDILCAFNQRAIRCVHAQHICHVRKAQRNGDGLISSTDVLRDWYEATHQYRFERISRTEVRRVDLFNGGEEVFGLKPNERGEAIDVPLFIARRRLRAEHYLCGETGAEVWYGGRMDVRTSRLDQVWQAIETKTPLREADHQRWPAGQQDLRSHLFIRTNEFDDATAETLISSEYDTSNPEQPLMLTKRLHKTEWRAVLGLTSRQQQDILNRDVPVDLRDIQYVREVVARQKTVLEGGR